MNYIANRVFDNFIIELDMYYNQLNYVLNQLDLLDEKIEAEFKRIESNYNPEKTDASVVWSQVLKNILGEDTTFIPYYQRVGAIAGYCIIIFHLLERFLEEISYLKDNKRMETFNKFCKNYYHWVETVEYKKLDELRLVANYCKHGRCSEKKLKEMRPDYFVSPFCKFDEDPLKPLSGYDIKITKKDFDDYMVSIKQFVDLLRKEM